MIIIICGTSWGLRERRDNASASGQLGNAVSGRPGDAVPHDTGVMRHRPDRAGPRRDVTGGCHRYRREGVTRPMASHVPG